MLLMTSFNNRVPVLSGPGDLLVLNLLTILRISISVAGVQNILYFIDGSR